MKEEKLRVPESGVVLQVNFLKQNSLPLDTAHPSFSALDYFGKCLADFFYHHSFHSFLYI